MNKSVMIFSCNCDGLRVSDVACVPVLIVGNILTEDIIDVSIVSVKCM
jgi:hypothetical protein